MTDEQKEQFLKDIGNYIIEEFLSYGVKFANPTIRTNPDCFLYIDVDIEAFQEELKDSDEKILRTFMMDTANEYIEKSKLKDEVKIDYWNVDVDSYKNDEYTLKLSKADRITLCLAFSFIKDMV